MVDLECVICGTAFQCKPYRAHIARCCSPACGYIYRSSKGIKPLAERFWAKVKKDCPNGCWEWQAALDNHGYGCFGVTSKNVVKSHRVAWKLEVGPIPPGVCLLHKCDNRLCVNPEHLKFGTRAENQADMVAKKRSAWGPRSGHAKLTPEIVRAIRTDARTCQAIADNYGITSGHVSNLKHRKAWSHLE